MEEEEETPVIPMTIPEGTDLQVMGMRIEEPGKIKTDDHKGTDQAPKALMCPWIDNIEHLVIS